MATVSLPILHNKFIYLDQRIVPLPRNQNRVCVNVGRRLAKKPLTLNNIRRVMADVECATGSNQYCVRVLDPVKGWLDIKLYNEDHFNHPEVCGDDWCEGFCISYLQERVENMDAYECPCGNIKYMPTDEYQCFQMQLMYIN